MTGSTDELRTRLQSHRIGVLGPVSLDGPSTHRTITGRPARLLVTLAAAQRPRSVEVLSDLLWGEDPPPTHRTALHVHLSTLRRELEAHGGEARIIRSGDGYRLDLGDCELDADLAVDLVTGARSAVDAQPRIALELAEQALALFRGTPFTIDGEVVDESSRQQLEAVHRDAEELTIEALLRLGEAAQAETAALRALESEPLREHRWGQLLRARYLAGRTADALATYQEARASLVEQLGIEPGPHLRDLEAAALTHDIARLRLPGTSHGSMPSIPAAPSALIGRDVESQRLATALAQGHLVALLGPPGVGKSRLAIEVAQHFGSEAVVWIDLREHATSLLPPDGVSDWARQHPEGLVVLDNADVATGGWTSAITEIARHAPTIHTLVTSRTPVAGATAIESLRPLAVPLEGDPDDAIEATAAVQLLRAALQELAPNAAFTSTEASRVARIAGGLPLVLRLMAAAARALPPDLLIARGASIEGDEIDLATRAVVDLLEDEAARAFRDLSCLQGDFDADLARLITGLELGRLGQVMIELVGHGLVEAKPERPMPYTTLGPIRAVGVRLLGESGTLDQVRDRHASACVDRARRLAAASGTSLPDLEERLARDLTEHRRALEHLEQVGDAEQALSLVCHLEGPLYTLGWWAEKLELLDAALAIPGEPSVMRARAHAFRSRPGPMHLFDLGHAELAEKLASDLGHHRLVAYAQHLQSIGLWWSGEADRAVALATTSSEALAVAGLTEEWCEARKFLGVALVFDGEPDAGLEVQRDVLATVRGRGNRFGIAHNLAYLGHSHRLLGDDVAARADFTEARELCRRIGNRGTAIHVEVALGEIAIDHGQPAVALEHTAEAIELMRQARSDTYRPWAWTVAMRASALTGDLDAAVACAWRAIEGLATVPPGETVRLAIELAHTAMVTDDLVSAARLLGVVTAAPDRRELPFPSPKEGQRLAEVERKVQQHFGDAAAEHVIAGRRCSISEAAATLLVR